MEGDVAEAFLGIAGGIDGIVFYAAAGSDFDLGGLDESGQRTGYTHATA